MYICYKKQVYILLVIAYDNIVKQYLHSKFYFLHTGFNIKMSSDKQRQIVTKIRIKYPIFICYYMYTNPIFIQKSNNNNLYKTTIYYLFGFEQRLNNPYFKLYIQVKTTKISSIAIEYKSKGTIILPMCFPISNATYRNALLLIIQK